MKKQRTKEEAAAIKAEQDALAANPPILLIRRTGGKAIMVRRSDLG